MQVSTKSKMKLNYGELTWGHENLLRLFPWVRVFLVSIYVEIETFHMCEPWLKQ